MIVGMTLGLLKDRYQTIQELGSGGFGKTYLAEDTHMPSRRKCVIKQLKAVNDNPQIYNLILQRFEREAALLEDLGELHSQIPRLYAYFNEDDRFYVVEEWIEGQTLDEKMRREGAMSEKAVRDLLLNLLPVLEFIQSKGIIHRDIKPENIILRSADRKPVLIDFGAVKETMATVVTASGNSERSIIAGTPGFMASEQCAGRPVFASDLYGLGLTAIYLLTGKLPAELENNPHTGEIRWQHLAPHINQNFAAFINKAVQPNARDRYINAKVMLQALQTLPGAPATFITSPPSSADSDSFKQQSTVLSSANDSVKDSVPDTTPPIVVPVRNDSVKENIPDTIPPTVVPVRNESIKENIPDTTPVTVISQHGNLGAAATPPTMLDPQSATVNNNTFNNPVRVPPQTSNWNWGSFLVAGLIGLILAAIPAVFVLNQYSQYQAKNSDSSTPETPTSNQPSDSQPEVSPSPSPSPSPSVSPTQTTTQEGDINTPPLIGIGNGKTERAIAPTANIDGYWRLEFSVGAVNHQSVLYMNGANGEMLTSFYDQNTQKQQQVLQTMRLWSCSLGLIIKGHNPVDFETKQATTTYNPDEILLQQKPDGTYYADNCSGGVCSTVRVQYIGKTLDENQNQN